MDARAIHRHGIDGFELMTRAADFAKQCLLQCWPGVASVSILTGKGNNAGDGYVLAALLKQLGLPVDVLQVGDPPEEGDGATAVRYADQHGVQVRAFDGEVGGDVIVDALLGTGVSGSLREPYLTAVRCINETARPVLAIDLPTGLNADTGGAVGEIEDVVRAQITTTFITRKIGHQTGLGLEVCGEVLFSDLRAPRAAYEGGVSWLTEPVCREPLPVNAYKHGRGHILVVGGDVNMGGAVLLAGEAALRSGAGMVTLACRPEHRPAALARRPELMVQDAGDYAALGDLVERASVVVLGPGLGRDKWSQGLFDFVLRQKPERLLVDADGLYHLAGCDVSGVSVVTPHAAEAARLLDVDVATIQQDRPAAAKAIADRYGAVTVLKGAGSIVAACDAEGEKLAVCGRGTPAMATAGMGDVLSGVVAAGLSDGGTFAATCAGVVNHAVAGELAEARVGRNLLASDLFAELATL